MVIRLNRLRAVLLVILTRLFSAALLGGAPPASPSNQIIKITWKEQGKAVNGSWQAQYANTFRLSSMWTGTIGGGFSLGGKTIMVGAGMSSPEGLYKVRGSLLGLKPGEMVQYYLSESDGSGTETVGSPPTTLAMKEGLSRDGMFTLSIGSKTFMEGDLKFRKDQGVPANENFPSIGRAYSRAIDVKRTQDGIEVLLGMSNFTLPYSPHGPNFPEDDCSQAEGTQEKVFEALKTFKFTNAELQNQKQVSKSRMSSNSVEGDTYSASVTITITEDEEETEVTVLPEERYEKWVPEGNLGQPGEQGNQLKIRLMVHKKGDPGTPRRANLVLTLQDVSKEKGVCMNWPSKGANTGKGLRLLQKENPDLEVPGPDQAKTKEEVEEIPLVITSHDFGAYGVLHVTGKDLKRHEVKVTIQGRGTPDLHIPKDENQNHIADSWEVENVGNLQGQQSDDLDDDPPGKPGTDGDGLSLYEEYRGFVVKGDHLRTSPKKKDYFVCDLSNNAGPGIQFFQEKTRLAVHQVTQDELGDESKVVNHNYSSGSHAVDQHGVLIRPAPSGIKDPEAIGAPPGIDPGPPGTTDYVAMPETDYVSDPMTVKGAQGAMAASVAVVAHELCHTVGVYHHGDADIMAVKWEWRTGADGVKRLFEMPVGLDAQPVASEPGVVIRAIRESDGQELKPEDDLPTESKNLPGIFHVFWKNGPKKEGTQGSGASSCIMCYSIGRAYPSSKLPGVRYVIPPQERVRDPFAMMLCDSGSEAGTNDAGHPPESHHGPATSGRGNCKAQIVVNDKYANK